MPQRIDTEDDHLFEFELGGSTYRVDGFELSARLAAADLSEAFARDEGMSDDDVRKLASVMRETTRGTDGRLAIDHDENEAVGPGHPATLSPFQWFPIAARISMAMEHLGNLPGPRQSSRPSTDFPLAAGSPVSAREPSTSDCSSTAAAPPR